MHGQEKTYGAVRGLTRSRVGRAFADEYNKFNPGSPLRVGWVWFGAISAISTPWTWRRARAPGGEAGAGRWSPDADPGSLRHGSVWEKLDAAREQQAGFEAAQMGFFADGGDLGSTAAAQGKPLGADERYTVGDKAKRLIGAMMPRVGQNFRAG